MSRSIIPAVLTVFLISCLIPSSASSLAVPVGKAMVQLIDGDTVGLSWNGDTVVWDAEAGDRALFAFPLSISRTVRFEDYGLCVFDVKVSGNGGPVEVMVFAERPGERRRIWRAVEIHGQPAARVQPLGVRSRLSGHRQTEDRLHPEHPSPPAPSRCGLERVRLPHPEGSVRRPCL